MERTTDKLTDEQAKVLAFEKRGHWKFAGRKEAVIRDELDMSSVRYYQVLNAVLDHPAALKLDAPTVNRLVRLRMRRRGVRTAG